MSTTNLANPLELLSVEVEPGIRYSFDDTYIVDSRLIERDPAVLARLQRKVFVEKMTPALHAYNQMSLPDGKIHVKTDFNEEAIDACDWHIPDEYKRLNLKDIALRLMERQEHLKLDIDGEYDVRMQRIKFELTTFQNIGKLDMIRLMCYIVDTMTAANQIWGVGRGSSVSSYVLFLIGVHDIDSVKYDLDFTDFVKLQDLP